MPKNNKKERKENVVRECFRLLPKNSFLKGLTKVVLMLYSSCVYEFVYKFGCLVKVFLEKN